MKQDVIDSALDLAAATGFGAGPVALFRLGTGLVNAVQAAAAGRIDLNEAEIAEVKAEFLRIAQFHKSAEELIAEGRKAGTPGESR